MALLFLFCWPVTLLLRLCQAWRHNLRYGFMMGWVRWYADHWRSSLRNRWLWGPNDRESRGL